MTERPDKSYETLKKEIEACRLCQPEFGFEPHPIVWGNPQAKIMQISQAPSKTVHETYRPFNDASGRRLRQDWYGIEDEVFYNPDYFYIVSVGHCYPGKLPGGGDRRPPKRCRELWLRQELEFVKNEIYIIVGKMASDFFFPKREFTSLVFENQQIMGKQAYVIPHPSPLNMKWFKDHPEFEAVRIKEISAAIHKLL